jgi:DNA-binding ferritin-like protein
MNLNSNVNFFLGLQTQMKINHWQTKGYARHKAFGDFYATMDVLIDTFVETAMGKYGRFVLDESTKTIELNNLSDIDIKGLISTVRTALIEISTQLDETDTDLLNIKDEMIGEVNKLSYLLTLE